MTEHRRVELVSSAPLPVDEKKEERTPTVRLSITITESNDVSFPEFSYTELLLKNAPVSRYSRWTMLNTVALRNKTY